MTETIMVTVDWDAPPVNCSNNDPDVIEVLRLKQQNISIAAHVLGNLMNRKDKEYQSMVLNEGKIFKIIILK